MGWGERNRGDREREEGEKEIRWKSRGKKRKKGKEEREGGGTELGGKGRKEERKEGKKAGEQDGGKTILCNTDPFTLRRDRG